jgi:hypothetical protein
MPANRIIILGALLCAVLVFGACNQAPARPTPPPVATAVPFTPLPEALRTGAGRTATLGYLVAEQQGAWLADTVRVGDGTISILTPDNSLVWCGDAAGQVEGALLGAQGRRYALVSVDGELQGPGRYGPEGRFAWQIASPQVRVVAPQETSIAMLLAAGSNSARRVVRLNGHVLLNESSALLIDKLGAGGIPEPGAQQLKLRRTARDAQLEQQLQSIGAGAFRTGQVQVEGYLDNGALTVLSMQVLGH